MLKKLIQFSFLFPRLKKKVLLTSDQTAGGGGEEKCIIHLNTNPLTQKGGSRSMNIVIVALLGQGEKKRLVSKA